MLVRSIRVQNYKGFADTGEIFLDPKWNVVVGQNNSGKTALIECFRFLRLANRPHKNGRFDRDHTYDGSSRVWADVVIRPREEMVLARRHGGRVHIPVPPHASDLTSANIFVQEYFSGGEHDFPLEFRGDGGPRAKRRYPGHGLFSDGQSPFNAQVSIDSNYSRVVEAVLSEPHDTLPDRIISHIEDYVYVFDAERFSLGTCDVSHETILAQNASNLAAVLLNLSANPSLNKKYNENVSRIFPNIHWVATTVIGNQKAEVRVSTYPIEEEREDLAIPLAQCGTGVGQVLAILYVAMTQPAGVIVIDEPNSFLHPGAAKKLIQILKRYDQHQYVISTHSPEVISAAQPAKLHLVNSDGRASTVQSFADTKVEDIRMMLEEVGASLADVFGAERVVWVEGPTERICFDLIIESCFDGPIVGLSFISLRNTGDFERKGSNTDAVLDIYNSLSTGGAILPVTVAFSFDGEERTEQQKADLIRRCDGKAHILPRRMTENYLLDADAIGSVLTSLQGRAADTAEIARLLAEGGSEYLPRNVKAEFGSDEFLTAVDGARLLNQVFQAVTEGAQEYRKTRDAAPILRAILAAKFELVAELIDYVGDLVGLKRQAS